MPLTEADGLIWPENKWSSLNLERSKSTFDSLAWLTERLSLPPALHEWNFPKEPGQAVCAAGCQCCAPSQPQMRWLNVKGKVMAREDPQEAAEYECRIKVRYQISWNLSFNHAIRTGNLTGAMCSASRRAHRHLWSA